jgi:hypothetical protein
MTNTTPITQPPRESLANALQVAEVWRLVDPTTASPTQQQAAFASISRLIRDALAKMAEPNEAALQAAAPWVEEHGPLAFRNARDLCAVILKAQLEGGLR